MSSLSTANLMYVFCAGGLVVFSALYAMFHCRMTERHKDDDDNNNNKNTGKTTDEPTPPADVEPDDAKKIDDNDDDDNNDPKEAPVPRHLRPRQPGEPIYDKYIIGGTLSMGVLTWIGATIVLIVSLLDQSQYSGASLGDFVSLGPDACRITGSASYTTRDKELNALNSVCVEEWEYIVRVEGEEEEEDVEFISNPISVDGCRSTCESCSSRLFGPDFYAGRDDTVRGMPIDNETFVECWASTIPASELSDFYSCDTKQQQTDDTCYLLHDKMLLLEERMDNVQIGLICAYSCYAVGALLLLVTAFSIRRNQQVFKEEMQLMTMENNKHDELENTGPEVDDADEEGCRADSEK